MSEYAYCGILLQQLVHSRHGGGVSVEGRIDQRTHACITPCSGWGVEKTRHCTYARKHSTAQRSGWPKRRKPPRNMENVMQALHAPPRGRPEPSRAHGCACTSSTASQAASASAMRADWRKSTSAWQLHGSGLIGWAAKTEGKKVIGRSQRGRPVSLASWLQPAPGTIHIEQATLLCVILHDRRTCLASASACALAFSRASSRSLYSRGMLCTAH
jgi:hypothetical protein